MIVERGSRGQVVVRHRDSSGKRVESRFGCNPFLFVEETQARLAGSYPGARLVAGEYTGLYGENLCKIEFADDRDMKSVARDFKTWEANIAHTNRVLAENNVTIEPYAHRILYLDMEWMISSGAITIVVMHDSIEGEFVLFRHPDIEPGYYDSIPCANHPEGLAACSTTGRKFKAVSSEKELLADVARIVRKLDPDIITGWNVTNADVQQLFKRFKANDMDIRDLSPMRRVRYDFGEWAQPIVGTNVIDLMVAFKKLWTIKNGQLPGMSLSVVSKHCLDDDKVDLPDGHDTYFTDIGTYLDYARQDVRLLPRLNDLVGATGFFTAIQDFAQCDIRTTPFITQVFSVLALRDADFDRRIPTKPQFEKVAYSGADIQDPDPGVYPNIGIFDVRAMYHSNVNLHNISWDTLHSEGQDCGNGTRFTQAKQGLLGRQMDLMTNLRNRYKRGMKEAKTEDERRAFDVLQNAAKHLVASMYGVAGDAKCGLYHPEIAAAITYTSRQTLFRLRDHAQDLGCAVRYGHTDSIMADVRSPEHGLEVVAQINERMAPIVVEFEKWCESFLIMAKNRYAGLVAWSGEHHEPEVYVKGIEMKQSRLPRALKRAMGAVVEGILRGEPQSIVCGRVEDLVKSVVGGEVPVMDLLIRSKLTKDLGDYTSLSEGRAGAAWANAHLGKGYRKDDYFWTTLNDNGDYIAFDDPAEIEGIAQVGFAQIAQRFLVDKVRPYYTVMGWDTTNLDNALNGLADMGWL